MSPYVFPLLMESVKSKMYRIVMKKKDPVAEFDKAMKVVCSYLNVTEAEIRSDVKLKGVSTARSLLMYVFANRHGVAKTGRLTNRHHTTVISAVGTVKKKLQLKEYQHYIFIINLIEESLQDAK